MSTSTAVTLVGATGLTGSHTLSSLLSSPHTFNITALTRRALPDSSPPNGKTKLITRMFTSLFDAPGDKDAIAEKGAVYVSCLGTTRAAAGGTADQEKLDLGLNKDLAKRAKDDGAQMLILVSSSGASPTSRMFYPRIKGLLEEYVTSLDFQHTIILRPGLLLGDRQDSRPAEAMARWAVGGLKNWGLPLDSLAVESKDIGDCIAHLAANPPADKVLTLGNPEIISFAKQYRGAQMAGVDDAAKVAQAVGA